MTESSNWTFGFGLGTHLNIGLSTFLEFDISTQNIIDTDDWSKKLNQLSKFRIIAGWKVNDFISIYAGPSFNYFVSEDSDGSDIALWTINDKKSGERWERMWVGFTFGVRF